MRLTLRTMLAYMDDILEPADHQDIGQKIEESEFATNLLHKIRDVTRQTRMGAPKVSGRGMVLDPNTVAEYLDNVLSGERVPDFEKVCLESSVHLAEVAACHQILSLVLGEPADVDPELRRRMYEIGTRSDEKGLSESDEADEVAPPPRIDADPGQAAAFDATRKDRTALAGERLEVPEYLRSQRRSRLLPIAITALLAACLLVAVGMALWGWDRSNPMLKWLPWDKMAPNVAQNETSKNGGTPTNTGQTPPATVEPGAASTAGTNPATPNSESPPNPPPNPLAASAGTAAPGQTPPPPGANVPTQPPPGAVARVAASNAIGAGATPEGAQSRPAGAPPGPGPVIGPAPPGAVIGGPGPATAPPAAAGAAAPGGPPPNGPLAGPGAAAPGAPGQAPPATPPTGPHARPGAFAPGADLLGRMVSEQELLLRLPAAQEEWQRVGPGQTLGLKDRLLALPTFRPTITLSAGLTLQLRPETLLELDGYDAGGIPIVRLEYGRLVMMTAGKPDVQVKLILGDTSGTLTFFDPDATAAIEVRPVLVPGTDPETGPPKLVVALYATAGQIDWTGAMGAAGNAREVAPADQPPSLHAGGKLTAPSRIMLLGSSDDVTGGEHELPRWVAGEQINPLDIRASQTLNQSLDGKNSVTVTLRELVEHRRLENRSLAARSLALIGEFDPFVALLNDPDQLIVWPTEIESLQSALARGPVVAGKVRATFERARGKEGDSLYRLLWGFNKDQLQSGAAPILVDDLDNPSLDFRVLSFYNLQKIVGKTFDYRPEATAASRAQPVRRWRDQLKEGLIVPKGAPPSKTQAAAAKTPETPRVSDAARGLESAVPPAPKGGPAGAPPASPTKLPPPPVPGQD